MTTVKTTHTGTCSNCGKEIKRIIEENVGRPNPPVYRTRCANCREINPVET